MKVKVFDDYIIVGTSIIGNENGEFCYTLRIEVNNELKYIDFINTDKLLTKFTEMVMSLDWVDYSG